MGKTAPKSMKVRGFEIFQGAMTRADQESLVDDIRKIAAQAPLIRPTTPGGRKMSVRMTSAGRVGWITDARGYRYSEHHPSGGGWPAIPQAVLELWQRLSGCDRKPDCCLINFYDEEARMGMHQDNDEGDFQWPVLSISLGDDALFRMGNVERGGKTEALWLSSGDVVVMGGTARLAHHGVDKLRFKSSTLLPRGGRINLTLRVVEDRP
jgi:alkylated DNA repair protein (DNA oxidative demethylase)